MLKIVSLLRFY